MGAIVIRYQYILIVHNISFQSCSYIDCWISVNMEIISTKRGGKKLCLAGYMYTIKNVAKSKYEVSWCCVKRDCVMKCAAVLKTKSTLVLGL